MIDDKMDVTDLKRAFEDVIYELRTLKNSVSANKHYPEVISSCRELELLLKGIILEIIEAMHNQEEKDRS